jgi:hypothetical protein
MPSHAKSLDWRQVLPRTLKVDLKLQEIFEATKSQDQEFRDIGATEPEQPLCVYLAVSRKILPYL